MDKKYIPKYKYGQLLVLFKENCPDGIPKYLEKKFGYKMIESNFDWHIYDIGKNESNAIKNFTKYNEFIKWTEKRDIRLEERMLLAKDLEVMALNLDKDYETNNFKKKLNEIVKYIKKFKD